MTAIHIESMQPSDWPAARAIYEEGLATGTATFETTAPAWEAWDQNHLPTCRMVAKESDSLLGWAALSPISSRKVYAGVASISIYIAAAARGRGVGKTLLQALIDQSEACGFWTLQSSIFAENEASRALHRSCGFREVGCREKIGQLNGIWHDTVLMERRSKNI